MANTYVPDQSDQFKRSGMKLITDPSSDALLKEYSDKRDQAKKIIKEITND